eukprot:4870136-Alexandrium_andersonii.AAC.1
MASGARSMNCAAPRTRPQHLGHGAPEECIPRFLFAETDGSDEQRPQRPKGAEEQTVRTTIRGCTRLENSLAVLTKP